MEFFGVSDLYLPCSVSLGIDTIESIGTTESSVFLRIDQLAP